MALVVSARLDADQFWGFARGNNPRRVLALANLVEVGGADLDRPEFQVVRVGDLTRVAEEPVTRVLHRDAQFIGGPACLANAIFDQYLGYRFPTCFMVAGEGPCEFTFKGCLGW